MPNPEEDWAQHLNPGVVGLDALHNESCVVLLGESGLGKSDAIRGTVEELTSTNSSSAQTALFDLKDFGTEFSLVRNLFESQTVAHWGKGRYRLTLFLDSLDEGLLQIETLGTIIPHELERLDTSRLALRIACRPVQWPSVLENELVRLWQLERLNIYRLAPLREQDVRLAAADYGVDPDQFVAEVLRKEVSGFARHPYSLAMLIGTFRERGALPPAKSEIYRTGCQALCTEFARTRQERLRPRLLPEERLVIAERLAALTVFCNKSTIRTLLTTTPQASEELAAEDVYGLEPVGNRKVRVDAGSLRETLDTGLFCWRGHDRAGWEHRMNAEYLAAAYCVRHRLSVTDLQRLTFVAVAGDHRVAPQLSETAAWLASSVPDYRELVLRNDPIVLLRSELTSGDVAIRKQLAGGILQLLDRGVYFPEHIRPDLALLSHPELASQVQPYVSDKSKSNYIRRTAMDILEACKPQGFESLLTSIATDDTESHSLRAHAVYTLAQIGSNESKEILKRFLSPDVDDPDDELKGWALHALWPKYISAEELFAALTPPKRENFLGGYGLFLRRFAERIDTNLQDADLPVALRWVAQQTPQRFPGKFEGMADVVIVRAWPAIDEHGEVVRLLSHIVLARIRKHLPIVGSDINDDLRKRFDQLMRGDDRRRHFLIRHLVPLLIGNDRIFALYSSDRLISDGDLAWLISEMGILPNAEREVVCDLLERGHRTAVVLDSVHRALAQGMLPEKFRSLLYVERGSAEQAAQRHRYALYLKHQGRPSRRRRKIDPSPKQRVLDLLQRIEGGKPEWWPQLTCELTLEPESTRYGDPAEDLRSLPGWRDNDEAIRKRITEAAVSYLTTQLIDPTAFIGSNTFPGSVIAAHQALALVACDARVALERQPPTFWAGWAPLVLWYPFDDSGESNNELTRYVWDRARDEVMKWMMPIMNIDKIAAQRVLDKLNPHWDQHLQEVLGSALIKADFNTTFAEPAIAVLLSHRDLSVEQAAVQVLQRDESDERVMLCAVALVRYSTAANWAAIWSRVNKDPHFGTALVERLATASDLDFVRRLSEAQIADLFVWIAQRFPFSEDPQHHGVYTPSLRDEVADFRNALLNYLTGIGTQPAVLALQNAKERLPGVDWLRWNIVKAKSATVSRAWVPVSPQDLLSMSGPEVGTRDASRYIGVAIAIIGVLSVLIPSGLGILERIPISVCLMLLMIGVALWWRRSSSFWFPFVVLALLTTIFLSVAMLLGWRP